MKRIVPNREESQDLLRHSKEESLRSVGLHRGLGPHVGDRAKLWSRVCTVLVLGWMVLLMPVWLPWFMLASVRVWS